jgi:hypothetical protein
MDGFIVLAEGLDVFRLRAVDTDRFRLPSGNLFFAKRTLVGWVSGSCEDEIHLSNIKKDNTSISYKTVVDKLEQKRPLRRPRRILEDNIKMDLREIECEGMDWI